MRKMERAIGALTRTHLTALLFAYLVVWVAIPLGVDAAFGYFGPGAWVSAVFHSTGMLAILIYARRGDLWPFIAILSVIVLLLWSLPFV